MREGFFSVVSCCLSAGEVGSWEECDVREVVLAVVGVRFSRQRT